MKFARRNERGVAISERIFAAVAVLALTCFATACKQVRRALQPAHNDQPQSVELQRDREGRPVRVNPVTGEATRVEADKLPDVHPPLSPIPRRKAAPPGQPRRSSPSPSGQALDTAEKTARLPDARAAGNAASRERVDTAIAPNESPDPIDLSISGLGATNGGKPAVRRDSTVTTVASAPIFVTANRHQAALLQAPQGATFRVVGIEGDWYRVEWDDHVLGRRQGFLDRKDATLPDSPLATPRVPAPRDGWRHADMLVKGAR